MDPDEERALAAMAQAARNDPGAPTSHTDVLQELGLDQPPRGRQLRTWLRTQRGRNDPVSDFADDVLADPDWPEEAESLGEVLDYLQERDAAETALDAARCAWDEFEAHTGE